MQYRSHFFSGSNGPSGTLFRTGNEPRMTTYKSLFESILFTLEEGDTAGETKAGHAKISTDVCAALRSGSYSDSHTRFIVAEQLPWLKLEDYLNDEELSEVISTHTTNGLKLMTTLTQNNGRLGLTWALSNACSVAAANNTVIVTSTGSFKWEVAVNPSSALLPFGLVKLTSNDANDYFGNKANIEHFNITAIAGANTIAVRMQDTSSIQLSSDASGIKASAILNSTYFQTGASGIEPVSGKFCYLDGTQTITGKKIFASATGYPELDSYVAPSTNVQFSPKKYVDDQINTCVKLAGNQTIADIKTFSSFPVTPSSAPISNYQVANKKYVDDAVGMWVFGTGSYSCKRNFSISSASGDYALSAGVGTSASGMYSAAFGYNTSASGHSSMALNMETTASGNFSLAVGRMSVSNLTGSFAIASGIRHVNGDTQKLSVQMMVETTNATPANMELDSVDAITVEDGFVYDVEIRVLATQTGGTLGTVGDSLAQKIVFTVKVVAGVLTILANNAATEANVHTVTSDVTYVNTRADATFGGTVAITTSGTTFSIEVTGEADKAIAWMADIVMLQLKHGAVAPAP